MPNALGDVANVSVVGINRPSNALADPSFIIQVGSVYYLTAAVWEYDMAKAQTQAQKNAVQAIIDQYNLGRKVAQYDAAPAGVILTATFQQTNPKK